MKTKDSIKKQYINAIATRDKELIFNLLTQQLKLTQSNIAKHSITTEVKQLNLESECIFYDIPLTPWASDHRKIYVRI